MAQKPSIKIIKRGERERKAAQPRPSAKAAPVDFSRDVTLTISGWVKEFQHRRRAGSVLQRGEK